ncbi:MAG TPA: gentisate 1,2-dioxygenase [Myxococcota bacterium]|nr:gentisate 1,2-dioxygenase [Myxococcota bacterium]
MQGARRTAAGPDSRQAFYGRIAEHQLAPLWEVIRQLLVREPTSDARPHLWRYAVTRPLLLEAGDLISAEEAERRVLILENPGLPGAAAITETLYAGLQLILPGEVAPAHRHSPSAIRFVLEGSGAYTAVDGEKAFMQPGDLVLTPSWTWHDHAHPGEGPMIWLDVLDLPLLRALGPRFAEDYPAAQFPETRPPSDAESRYGANMRPVGDRFERPHSPLFRYPYERSRDALARLRRAGDVDPCLGIKLEYIDPRTGGPAVPTISNFLQLLPSGFESRPYQASDASVYSVVEGHGRTRVGAGERAATLEWGPRDQFIVPRWQPHVHACDEEAVLYSASDRGLQQMLGLWRERRESEEAD